MPAKTPPQKAPGANFMKGRPTLYKGIRMRSRLEADYAAWLDREGRTWKYEPECYAAQDGQWLPDFRIDRLRADTQVHLVELKPAQMLECRKGEHLGHVIARVDAVISKMRPVFDSEPEASIDLVFWRYGASEPELDLCGSRSKPWTAWVPGFPLPLPWIGAGQIDVLGIFAETAAEIAWGKLADEPEGGARAR